MTHIAVLPLDLVPGDRFPVGDTSYVCTGTPYVHNGMIVVPCEPRWGGGWGPVRIGSPMTHLDVTRP